MSDNMEEKRMPVIMRLSRRCRLATGRLSWGKIHRMKPA